MTLVDFTKVRASLAGKSLVGFDNGMTQRLDKAGTTKSGLIKNGTTKCGMPKVNGAKRGPKPSPAQA